MTQTLTVSASTGAPRARGLVVDNVSVLRGDNLVLDRLSFDVPDGKLMALLGPSGCGKSTALGMLTGLIPQSAGKVWLDGRDVTHNKPNKRDISLVFQNYALFPHLSVRQNILYGLKARKVEPDEYDSRLRHICELVGITALLDRYPQSLSGGQQQRVALARALVVQPALLLMDEPLSNLDAKLREQVRMDIRSFQRQLEQTTILVTHDREEALVMGDFLGILDKGRIAQAGPPADVWQRPVNRYVADFVGFENIVPIGLLQGDSVARSIPNGALSVAFRASAVRLIAEADRSEPGAGEVEFGVRTVDREFRGDRVRLRLAVASATDDLTLISSVETGAEVSEPRRVRIAVGDMAFLPD